MDLRILYVGSRYQIPYLKFRLTQVISKQYKPAGLLIHVTLCVLGGSWPDHVQLAS
jgi:hypothetical protein